MASRSIVLSVALSFVLSGAFTCGRPAAAFQLITEAEAALPADPGEMQQRGISRGPTLVVESPRAGAGTQTSPMSLKVKFEAHGGAAIDLDSVQLTYVKRSTIDLTKRIKPYIAASGIDAQDAEIPPGTHTIRVDVSDTRGHSSSIEFTFSVSK
jgi:hypothetical protein